MSIYVSIEMTHQLTIEFFAKLFCRGRIAKIQKRNARHKDSWKYTVTGRDAVYVVTLLYPYLKTKSGQAKLIIEYGDKCMCSNYTSTNKVPEDVSILRKSIYDQLKVLNTRGVTNAQN